MTRKKEVNEYQNQEIKTNNTFPIVFNPALTSDELESKNNTRSTSTEKRKSEI